jgi:hypothetical protein
VHQASRLRSRQKFSALAPEPIESKQTDENFKESNKVSTIRRSSPNIEIQIGLLVYAHDQRQTVFMCSAVKILVEISGSSRLIEKQIGSVE